MAGTGTASQVVAARPQTIPGLDERADALMDTLSRVNERATTLRDRLLGAQDAGSETRPDPCSLSNRIEQAMEIALAADSILETIQERL